MVAGAASAADAGVLFEPAEGRVVHMAGQSRTQFPDYVEVMTGNGKHCPLPAGGAAYTSLGHDTFGRSLKVSSTDSQDVPYLLSIDRPLILHLALWLGAYEFDDMIAGKRDGDITRLGEGIRDCGRPVFLRIGYEFDGPHNAYPPEKYREVYRRIVDGIRKTGAKNVAYVWHSYAYLPTFGGHDIMAWYPGDEYADWIGISFFPIQDPGINRARLLEVCRERKRPMIICEASAIKDKGHENLSGEAYWDYWYRPFFGFIEENREVKAFSIINCNWDAEESFKNIGWGDARMTTDEVVVRRWREKMKDARYINGSPDLYRELGFRP